ncbi:MAG: lysylphosphatidylglycerol synthase domain-containing protein [Mycobacteriaceae bacterium]
MSLCSAHDIAALPVSKRTAKSVAISFGRIAVVLAISAAVTIAIHSQWSDVRRTFSQLSWLSLTGSMLLVVLGMGAAVRAWQHVLAELDRPIRAVDAGRCYLVGQLGKYLPGSVWAFVLQMELARRADVPRATGFVAVLVTVGLSTASALVVGLLGLPALFSYSALVAWVVVAAVPVALVCSYPPVLTRLVNLALRILRRSPLPRRLTFRGVAPALGWCAVSWVLYGISLWLLASDQSIPGAGGLVKCVGALALAMTAGVLAVVAPSGIGVREAVVVAALTPYMDPGIALGLALASRLVFTVAEVVLGVGAAVSGAVALRAAQRPDTQTAGTS